MDGRDTSCDAKTTDGLQEGQSGHCENGKTIDGLQDGQSGHCENGKTTDGLQERQSGHCENGREYLKPDGQTTSPATCVAKTSQRPASEETVHGEVTPY